MGDKSKGLVGKFYVRRNDGSSETGEKHDGCDYFVLDLTHDPHAIPALRAYSQSARADGYHALADDLDAKLPAQSPVGSGEVANELHEAVEDLVTEAAKGLTMPTEAFVAARKRFHASLALVRSSLQHSPVSPIQETEPCVWTQDVDGQYDTACGRSWYFDNGTLRENKAAFCVYCGHPIKDVPYSDAIEPDNREDNG